MAQVACRCGNVVRFGEDRRGSKARCPACGSNVLLDEGASPPPTTDPAPAARPTAARSPASKGHEAYLPYMVLLLALLPLVWTTFFVKDEPIEPRVVHEVEKAPPAVRDRIESLEDPTLDEVVSLLPGGRLPGALLPKKTIAHWVLAAISAGGFLGVILTLFPRGTATPKHLLLAGVFTGTVGIALLLLLQVIASASTGIGIRGGGRVAIFVLFCKLIGYSYSAALNRDNGFIPSFLGFTAGVGFCEELTKALPLIHLARLLPNTRGSETALRLDVRTLCALGLASGVGFGVSEGITYSSDYYNGVEGPGIYLVRFVSCVALHAIWAASVGLVLWKRRETIQGEIEWAILLPLVQILGVPMVLHGLYDTLLKQDRPLLALGVAIASFFWLAYCLEQAKDEPAPVA